MENNAIRVCMLGTFSVSRGDQEINDNGNRSKKVWLLLAYMIYSRGRPVSNEELASLLWSEEESSVNPVNALKTIFHRVRSSLDQLGDGAGHELLRSRGGYSWNSEVPLTLDIDEFESLCRKARETKNEEKAVSLLLRAVELYGGDFLSKLSSEPWVVPIAAYYHQLYLQAVLDLLPILSRTDRLAEAVRVCRAAIAVEPYNEDLYCHLLRFLLDLGEDREAARVYEEMRELLFTNFGIMPGEEAMSLYREAIRTVNDRTLSPDSVLSQLREASKERGALYCDYDFFRAIYQALARALERSGDTIHLGLISVSDKDGGELPKRSLDRVMENLQDTIRSSLRRGDVACQCSVSQFLLLLPQANYENSCMVCSRVVKAFARQYPHSPAVLRVTVHPLEPNLI